MNTAGPVVPSLTTVGDDPIGVSWFVTVPAAPVHGVAGPLLACTILTLSNAAPANVPGRHVAHKVDRARGSLPAVNVNVRVTQPMLSRGLARRVERVVLVVPATVTVNGLITGPDRGLPARSNET